MAGGGATRPETILAVGLVLSIAEPGATYADCGRWGGRLRGAIENGHWFCSSRAGGRPVLLMPEGGV